jgi:uncharacterized membrane protein
VATDTLVVLASQYDQESDALADFKAVNDVYRELHLMDTYDAAVLTKTDKGKVKIVKTHEQPTRQASAGGLAVGLATGAVVALFPAVGLAAGLIAGGAAGAGLGAIAGHVAGGMSRSDLKDLGELLDDGTSGLVVVAATDVEARVDDAITHAKKTMKKQLDADAEELKKEIDEA